MFQQTALGSRLKKKDQSNGRRSQWFFFDFPGVEDTAHHTMSASAENEAALVWAETQ